jgi:hypothetical protein
VDIGGFLFGAAVAADDGGSPSQRGQRALDTFVLRRFGDWQVEHLPVSKGHQKAYLSGTIVIANYIEASSTTSANAITTPPVECSRVAPTKLPASAAAVLAAA